jgi:hypothetical protein
MSELINNQNRHGSRWQLLSTVSALSLTLAVSAHAEASDKPTVWIELGGQLERVDSRQDPFQPPFTQLSPTPGPYSPISPDQAQKPAIYTYGGEGKITLAPSNSSWQFSAAVRYGRSNNNKHVHQQTGLISRYYNALHHNLPALPTYTTKTSQRFLDVRSKNSETHAIADFQAGRDVGLGLFGRDSSSVASFGVRVADFSSKSTVNMFARPDTAFHGGIKLTQNKYAHGAYHTDYKSVADMERNFSGIGPSVSWQGYVPIIGGEGGAITFDWGANAAVLFGRQKAKGTHQTTARYYNELNYVLQAPYGVVTRYRHPPLAHDRSRSVIVPNVGGLAGISFRYSAAKVSFGYRADLFLGAMDTGIDARHTVDRNFYGPFATISIGLGG